MTNQEAFAPGDSRSSALWGTGNRGGGQRSSALWGKGGRPFVTLAIAALALSLPMAALAGGGSGRGGPERDGNGTYVPQALLDQAAANPDTTFQVIVQRTRRATAAQRNDQSGRG